MYLDFKIFPLTDINQLHIIKVIKKEIILKGGKSLENSDLNWNLSDIFNGEKDYENAKMELLKLLSSIKSYQGKLCENTNTLLECYNLFEKALELYEKI